MTLRPRESLRSELILAHFLMWRDRRNSNCRFQAGGGFPYEFGNFDQFDDRTDGAYDNAGGCLVHTIGRVGKAWQPCNNDS